MLIFLPESSLHSQRSDNTVILSIYFSYCSINLYWQNAEHVLLINTSVWVCNNLLHFGELFFLWKAPVISTFSAQTIRTFLKDESMCTGQIYRRDQLITTVDIFWKYSKTYYYSISDRHDLDWNLVEKAKMIYSQQQTAPQYSRRTNIRVLGWALCCSI